MIAAADLELDPRALVSAFGVGRLDFDKLLVRHARFAPFVRGEANAFVIDLRGGFDAYEADRRAAGSDILRDAAKKRRQLAREKGEVLFTSGSTDRAAFDQLIAWKRAQYRATGQTDIFEAGWPLELLKALLASEDPACRAQLFTLHAGGRLAAAHLALTGRTLAHAWFIAHDPDCGRWSPGSILIAEVARWAAETGLAELDLGAGAYRFKTSFANQLRPVGYGFVGRPSAASLSRSAAYGARTLAEALPLGAASALPAKAMRRLDLVLSLR
jgi:CelD/BcsL family acetyltransferase involved in cellulose biosynthesis